MRAKMKVDQVKVNGTVDEVEFSAVCRKEGYGEDGLDENNTFSRFTPSANLSMCINNPALKGKFVPGQEFYVDFIAVE
jgi:hypothetical protein